FQFEGLADLSQIGSPGASAATPASELTATEERLQRFFPKARVPFHLGHHPAGTRPRLRLVAEAGVESLRLAPWAAHRTSQQKGDLPLQHRIRLEPDRVTVGSVGVRGPGTDASWNQPLSSPHEAPGEGGAAMSWIVEFYRGERPDSLGRWLRDLWGWDN